MKPRSSPGVSRDHEPLRPFRRGAVLAAPAAVSITGRRFQLAFPQALTASGVQRRFHHLLAAVVPLLPDMDPRPPASKSTAYAGTPASGRDAAAGVERLAMRRSPEVGSSAYSD
jgi:hypothetical protein